MQHTVRRYVALLRAVNVSGRNRLSMDDLRAVFEALGGQDVRTYVQSGNVVFGSAERKPAELIAEAEARLGRQHGVDTRVLLRTSAELAGVAAGNPFLEVGNGPATLHVTFLATAPDETRVRQLARREPGPDTFRLAGREVFLHCPNGYGRTKLTNAFFEKQLDVAATTRNWRTVTTLAELVKS